MADEIREDVSIPAPVDLKSQDNAELEAAGKIVSELIENDKFINATWFCIRTSFQLHQLLLAALATRVRDLKQPDLVYHILRRSAQDSAGRTADLALLFVGGILK